MALRSIVVDDEFNCRNNLKLMLEEFCPDVEVVGEAESAEQARNLVNKLNPSVVFLDIMMPKEDGFAFLNSIDERNFSVVFTTAHNEHAISAIKQGAIDYIEKPINIDDLQFAVSRAKEIHSNHEVGLHQEAVQDLMEETANLRDLNKASIPTRDGYFIVKSNEIIHLEASEGYTMIHLTNSRRYLSCKNIKRYEEYLNSNVFFRVHKSHIINVAHHLTEYNKSVGNIAVLSNGTQIPISRRKLAEFLARINCF